MLSSISSNEEDSIERSYQCIKVLEKLQGTFPDAGYAIKFLGAAIRKSDFDIAVQRMKKRPELPESTTGSSRTTPIEKENRIALNASPPNAVGRAMRLKSLSDLS